MSTMQAKLEKQGGIAVLTVDNPPVNALSGDVRAAIAKCLDEVAGDRTLRGLVLACAGRTFVAGADINELGQVRRPMLREIIERIEALTVPSIAALHGTALGGGFELGLGCIFRSADTATRIGLPEVKLGLLPGAGGTVRTTYLAGPREALRIAGSGELLDAQSGKRLGLIDCITKGDPVVAARRYLEERIAAGNMPPPVSARAPKFDGSVLPELERIKEQQCRKARSRAPSIVAEAVRAAATMPFTEAMLVERRLFDEAVEGYRSKALRHLFFAERTAAKPSDAVAEATPRTVGSVGVIGAGTMGSGIALAFASHGYRVLLCETDAVALERGLERIEGILEQSKSRGTLSKDEAAARLSYIIGGTSMEAMSGVDLVVEAAFEDMAVKKEIFARLDVVCRPDAILATNTSYLDVDAIAAATSRPRDVVGLHFFSPAHVMKLVEIVQSKETARDVIATALKVTRTLEKQPVVVGNCHGFVGNRMLMARNRAVVSLILAGASPSMIDAAFRNFGWPMGPCEMQDLAGLDISWRNRKAQGIVDPLPDRLCELGRFGQKTGSGWYRYKDGDRRPFEDSAVIEIARDLALREGITRREVSDEEVIRRTHKPMVEEGHRLLAEGVAARPSDIDVVWTHGYGFPKDLGGPMFWSANMAGPAAPWR